SKRDSSDRRSSAIRGGDRKRRRQLCRLCAGSSGMRGHGCEDPGNRARNSAGDPVSSRRPSCRRAAHPGAEQPSGVRGSPRVAHLSPEAIQVAIQLYDLAGAEDDRRFSPYCWRTKMSLKHKGLDFESIPWRYTEKEAIAFTGSTTVPVIVDGKRAVYDSFEIAVYLDEAYPSRPGLFEGTESRALGFFMHHWAFQALHPPLLRAIVMDLFKQLHEKDRAYFRESRGKRLGARLEDIAADQKKWLADFRGALEPLRPALVQSP